MTAEEIVVGILIVFVVGMFTNFYGLGTFWANRGSWYTVTSSELNTVMHNLLAMKAFEDSDGIAQECVKLRAHANLPFGSSEVYYTVKVPDWIFKYQAAQLDEHTKLKMLGLTD